MSAATPLFAAAVLIWLAVTRIGRMNVAVSLCLLPVLVWFAPSRLELGLTILAEAPIVCTLFALWRLDAWRAATASCFINALTQPVLFLALIHLRTNGSGDWWRTFIAAELVVWLAEALLYLACLESLRRSPGRLAKALTVSLAANGASAVLGLLAPF